MCGDNTKEIVVDKPVEEPKKRGRKKKEVNLDLDGDGDFDKDDVSLGAKALRKARELKKK